MGYFNDQVSGVACLPYRNLLRFNLVDHGRALTVRPKTL